jgi:hypothetical protein
LKDKIIFRNTAWVSNLKALDSSFESIVPLKELQQKKVQLAKKVFDILKKGIKRLHIPGQFFCTSGKPLQNTAVASFVEKYWIIYF